MPRPLQRARLESGLKLNLNRLARDGIIRPGAHTSPVCIRWMDTSGLITADMSGAFEGWFRIQLQNLDQHITLVPVSRQFGGRQWYFVCPYTNRRASVLWMPLGARSFACRQRWGGQVAYASQFLDRTNRAHRGQAKIKTRLCSRGEFDPDEWDFPPKPKWMRWNTYNRAEEAFDRYEAILNEGILELVARLGMSI